MCILCIMYTLCIMHFMYMIEPWCILTCATEQFRKESELISYLIFFIYSFPRGEQEWGGATQEEVQPLESGAVHAEVDAGVLVYTRA
jgi:hypothetical protein